MTFCACSNAQANTYITVTLFRRLEEKKSEGEQFDQKQKWKVVDWRRTITGWSFSNIDHHTMLQSLDRKAYR